MLESALLASEGMPRSFPLTSGTSGIMHSLAFRYASSPVTKAWRFAEASSVARSMAK